MLHTLHQRLERARILHGSGYNCAQCVLLAFDDISGLSESKAAEITAALGLGTAGQRLTCGTMTATAIIKGIIDFKSPKDKPAIYRSTSDWMNEFRQKNGSIVCGELLTGADRKPCMQYIEDAITIIDNHLRED